MNEALKITGGCICGAVRYKSTSPPKGAGYCHCSICRKAYGHLYAALILFSREGFEITKGNLAYYKLSDLSDRGFCKDCGSSLIFKYQNQPTLFVLAGSLDSPDDWSFDDLAGSWGHTFMDDKVPWLKINDGLPQHNQSAGFLIEAESSRNGSSD